MTSADPRDGLLAFADRVERLAFSMPAPNPYTPRFVELAIAARSLAHARPEAVDDAMAMRAWKAYAADDSYHGPDRMRAALTAALTPDPTP